MLTCAEHGYRLIIELVDTHSDHIERELAGAIAALQPDGMILTPPHSQNPVIIRMLDEGRDCEDVVTQLSAVSRALDRAGFAVIASGMKQCMVPGADPEESTLDVAKLEKLFLSLA